jgi:hypothetical protein
MALYRYTNMICDNVGNIWLAANDESSIVSFDSSGIFSFRTLQPSWQTDGDLCNVYADGNYIWLNWQRNGLQLYDRKQNELTSLHNLNLPEMSVIRPSRGKTAVWVAQKYYSSAYRLIQQQNRVTVDEKVDLEAVLNDSQPIIDLVEDGKGVVWMLTPRHLAARINDLNRSIAIVDIEEPTAIAQSPRTSTLLCAAGRNLHRCKAEERYLTSNNVATFDMLSDNERVNRFNVGARCVTMVQLRSNGQPDTICIVVADTINPFIENPLVCRWKEMPLLFVVKSQATTGTYPEQLASVSNVRYVVVGK